MEFYIYIICLSAGFVFAMVSALFGHVLDGHVDVPADAHIDGAGGHGEVGLDNSGMPGVSPFSPTVIACFVACFGGLGLVFHSMPATSAPWASALLSFTGALAISAVLVWLLRILFRSSQGSSESRIVDVIGLVCEVITPIPANGVGEIAYVQKGARYSAPAREETGAAVANGQAVKIVRVAGTQFYVTAA